MLCCMDILGNCTKLDANGSKEMLHFNKLHILAIQLHWVVDKDGKPDKT